MNHFFVIQPSSFEGCIQLRPNMLADWDKGELRDFRTLDGTIDVKYERIPDGIRLTVRNHTSFPVIAETISDFPVELVLE